MKATKYLTAAMLAFAATLASTFSFPARAAITAGGDAGEISPTDPATWTTSTTAYIGQTSGKAGTVTVDAGSDLLSSKGYLGYYSNSAGTTIITGAGSTWTNSGTLYMGNGNLGSGIVKILNGGNVSSVTTYLGGYDPLALGDGKTSAGTATVTGSGSTWTNTGSLYVGNSGKGVLTVSDGGKLTSTGLVMGQCSTGTGTVTVENGGVISTNSSSIGSHARSSGTAIVTGPGSTWTADFEFRVGVDGSGTLRIEAGGSVNDPNGYLGTHAGSGTAIVTGAGSTWTNLYEFFVGGFADGSSGTGTLTIEKGGKVSTENSYIGCHTGASGRGTVTGPGSTWINSGALSLGTAYVPLPYAGSGTGTLTVADGGKVTAWNLLIDSSSALNLRVSGSGMLTVGRDPRYDGVSNRGKINLYADAFLAAGAYSPITVSGVWNGSGSYNATGGTWDNTAHIFTVAAATALKTGVSDTVTTGERLLISDLASGKRMGASFATVGTGINFKAVLMSKANLDLLTPALAPGESIRSAWDLTTNFASGTALLAFDIGLNQDQSSIKVWQFSGSAWTAYSPTDLIYDSHGIASFTVTGAIGDYAITAVPEPATLALVTFGSLALLRRKRAS